MRMEALLACTLLLPVLHLIVRDATPRPVPATVADRATGPPAPVEGQAVLRSRMWREHMAIIAALPVLSVTDQTAREMPVMARATGLPMAMPMSYSLPIRATQ